MSRSLGLAAGGAAALLVITASSARSDDPVSSAVRFNREIVRIFDRKCLACHSPGGIAMSLATYRDVRPWARAIREEIVEQRMPPTSAVRGYARLKDHIALTPRELATILTWLDGGLPRGDESDLPPPHAAPAVAEADHLVTLAPQQVPGNGEDVVRRVTADAGLEEDRWVQKIQLRPGDRRLLRAAFVSIETPGQPPVWAASWTPWQRDVAPAEPGAFLVSRGSRLSVELHYRGLDEPTNDTSAVAVFFAPEGTHRRLTSVALTPSPSKASRTTPWRAETPLKSDVVLWGGRWEEAAEGESIEVSARRPDGSVEVLLWVPSTNAEWPAPFIFEQPIELPAGTVIAASTGRNAGGVRTRITLTMHSVQ